VANIGVRPTFEEELDEPVIEAHLLGFDQDVYGRQMRLSFIGRLREERRFEDPKALVEQIGRDVERAKMILREAEEETDE
jgi:riboflavin kinase/FMN adenylyltransferase